MKKLAIQSYVVLLWALCGVALYSMFRTWWPLHRTFPDSSWAGDPIVAVLAAVIVEPAGRALGARWGAPN